jgi:hypothetical protein
MQTPRYPPRAKRGSAYGFARQLIVTSHVYAALPTTWTAGQALVGCEILWNSCVVRALARGGPRSTWAERPARAVENVRV